MRGLGSARQLWLTDVDDEAAFHLADALTPGHARLLEMAKAKGLSRVHAKRGLAHLTRRSKEEALKTHIAATDLDGDGTISADEFGKIDVLVTAFSTVGSEAAIFGVPVILVHPNATVAFDGLIDGQNVMYCNSADDSIAALQSLSARVIKVERSQSCGFSSFNTDCIV